MVIYLDTAIWIDLLNVCLQKKTDSDLGTLIDSLCSRVSARTSALPISLFHCIEAMSSKEEERRYQLWSFMVSLSKCVGILPKHIVLPRLIESTVEKTFNLTDKLPKPVVFTDSALFGMPLDRLSPIPHTKQLSRTNEGWLRLWLEMPPELLAQLIGELRLREREFVCRRNELKLKYRHENHDKRRLSYCAALFLSLQGHYLRTLARYGMGKEVITALSEKDLHALVLDIPPLDVEVCLANQHMQQWDKKEVINDVRDISHLCMAVPYCDVVVTEKYWVDKLRREELDKKYRTLLLSDVRELKSLF